jgi:hypothetical protein
MESVRSVSSDVRKRPELGPLEAGGGWRTEFREIDAFPCMGEVANGVLLASFA